MTDRSINKRASSLWTRVAIVVALAATAAWPGGPCFAQEPEDEAAAESPAVSQPLTVDPNLSSPRRTMRTFIEGMNRWEEGGKEEALSTLDLSGIKEQVRETEAPVLADMLKEILDRDRVVKYEEIPDQTEGQPYVHLRHPDGDIVIAPVTEGGTLKWRFTPETLANLRKLHKAYEDRRVVSGLPEREPRVFSLRLRRWVGNNAPFLLKDTILLENWQWLGLLLIILVGMAISRAVAFGLVLIIRRRFRAAAMLLDADLERDFVRPIRIAIMAWSWYLGLQFLGLPAEVLDILFIVAKAIIAAGGVWAAYRLVDILGGFLRQRADRTRGKFDDILVPLVVRSLKVFIIAFGIVFVAEAVDFNYKSILAGLGLGGLAFALAAKDTVSNIFGSLTVLIDRPFQIGDWVIIGDVEGCVETVGIRSTRIRTFYNSLITIPNSKLPNTAIDNMGARQYRRISAKLGVTYDTPPEKIEAFCEGVRELIRKHPYTRKDYFHVWFNEFGAHSLNILLYCFHECPDWGVELRERHRLFIDIVRLAKRLGVEFAFPTQTLHLRKDEDDAGDKPPLDADTPEAARDAGRREASEILERFLDEEVFKSPPGTSVPPHDVVGPEIDIEDKSEHNGRA